MNRFSRLTTGQAAVRFLAQQFAERDGHENPEKRMPGMGTWWDVPVAEVSGEEKTLKTRETHEKATENQRPVFA
jgi:TPP-dependent trihydroxycyclohexane-1,2-dione (THcHDO) dehydratase